jgi:CDP-glucose 4,6-dehydratase
MDNYAQCDLNATFRNAYSGKRVFVTGHTGFKGSWLCEWLLACGAEVHGYALDPVTDPSLFDRLGLAGRVHHQVADVRDAPSLNAAIHGFRPDIVFHLAAQPLVVASYDDPRTTFETNVLGTVNLLESLRRLDHQCSAILVTSDKCYRNDNSGKPFEETDPMGGEDPYSASKGAMEIVAHSYRQSFFRDSPVRIATVRAGNVIGGGDYAADRIVPDCVRSLSAGKTIHVRNPAHTRPFQHVMEPLSGYLWLAARMADGWTDPEGICAFNFGPAGEGHRSVRELVEEVLVNWPGQWESPAGEGGPAESVKLALSVKRAAGLLTWEPRWDFAETVRQTVDWYRAADSLDQADTEGHARLTRSTIDQFAKPDA